MPQEYDGEELIVDWTLLLGEETLVGSKHGPARLGFAVLHQFLKRSKTRRLEVCEHDIDHLSHVRGEGSSESRKALLLDRLAC